MQILRALKDDKDKEVKKMVKKVKRKSKREKLAQSGQTATPGSLTDALCKVWDWITNTRMRQGMGVKQVDSDVILGIKCIAEEDKIIGERLYNWETNSLTY